MNVSGRKAMLRVLQRTLVPKLRSLGFTGSLPHFRRQQDSGSDFLSIQFDKYGGGFVVELGRLRGTEFEQALEERPFADLNCWWLPSDQRVRLGHRPSLWRAEWLRYDKAGPWWRAGFGRDPEWLQQERAAENLLTLLPQAEEWFRSHPGDDQKGSMPNIL